MLIIKIESI